MHWTEKDLPEILPEDIRLDLEGITDDEDPLWTVHQVIKHLQDCQVEYNKVIEEAARERDSWINLEKFEKGML